MSKATGSIGNFTRSSNEIEFPLQKTIDLSYGVLAIGLVFHNSFEKTVPNALVYYMQFLYNAMESKNRDWTYRLLKWIYRKDYEKSTEAQKMHRKVYIDNIRAVCNAKRFHEFRIILIIKSEHKGPIIRPQILMIFSRKLP